MKKNGHNIEVQSYLLGGKDMHIVNPNLLGEGNGLKRESRMCEKAGTPAYPCGVELEFLTAEDARELKLPESTRMAIHKCVVPGSRDGTFTPVNSVTEALKVSKSFCDCVNVDAKPPESEPIKEAVVVKLDKARQKCARVK